MLNTRIMSRLCLLATLLLVSPLLLAGKGLEDPVQRGVVVGGTIVDGDVSFSFDWFDENFAAETQFNVDEQDHLYALWFFYRLSGDTQEFLLPPPDTESYVGDTATLTFEDIGGSGIDASLEVVIEEAAADGVAGILTATLTFNNDSPEAIDETINVFVYVDYDLDGASANDAATLVAFPDWIEVSKNDVVAHMRGGGADAYQVTEYSDLEAMLVDNELDDLDNTGLPFDPADFTGAFQWVDLPLFPGGLTRVQATLAVNIDAPEPAGPVFTGQPPPPPPAIAVPANTVPGLMFLALLMLLMVALVRRA